MIISEESAERLSEVKHDTFTTKSEPDTVPTFDDLHKTGVEFINCQDYETMNNVFCSTVLSLRKVLPEILNSIKIDTIEGAITISHVNELISGLVAYFSACIKRIADFLKTITGFEYPPTLHYFDTSSITGAKASVFTISSYFHNNPLRFVALQNHFFSFKMLSDNREFRNNLEVVCDYVFHLQYLISIRDEYINNNIASPSVKLNSNANHSPHSGEIRKKLGSIPYSQT